MASPVWNYLEIYWLCDGGLSAVNAIGTQLRDPINSGLTRWRMVAISGCMLLILCKCKYICIYYIMYELCAGGECGGKDLLLRCRSPIGLGIKGSAIFCLRGLPSVFVLKKFLLDDPRTIPPFFARGGAVRRPVKPVPCNVLQGSTFFVLPNRASVAGASCWACFIFKLG